MEYFYFGMRLSTHGVGTGESQHELAVVLVGAVADHLVLGRGVDVAQAFLYHVVTVPGLLPLHRWPSPGVEYEQKIAAMLTVEGNPENEVLSLIHI